MYPEHAPPASCQDGDFPKIVSRIAGACYPRGELQTRAWLWKCIRRGRPRCAEHERELALRPEPVLGRAVRRARRVEAQSTEPLLLEVAVLALDALRRRRRHALRMSPLCPRGFAEPVWPVRDSSSIGRSAEWRFPCRPRHRLTLPASRVLVNDPATSRPRMR